MTPNQFPISRVPRVAGAATETATAGRPTRSGRAPAATGRACGRPRQTLTALTAQTTAAHAWDEGFAAGRSAERARLAAPVAQALVVLGSAEWFAACASQPCPSCDPSGEGVEIGGEIKQRCREVIEQLRAALSEGSPDNEGSKG